MFSLAMEAKGRGRGVVGSTSDILSFIAKHTATALEQPFIQPLQVLLQRRRPYVFRKHSNRLSSHLNKNECFS